VTMVVELLLAERAEMERERPSGAGPQTRVSVAGMATGDATLVRPLAAAQPHTPPSDPIDTCSSIFLDRFFEHPADARATHEKEPGV